MELKTACMSLDRLRIYTKPKPDEVSVNKVIKQHQTITTASERQTGEEWNTHHKYSQWTC